jgi:hypothetical protein
MQTIFDMSCTFLEKCATPTDIRKELHFSQKMCNFIDMDCTFLKKYATATGFRYELHISQKSRNGLLLQFSKKKSATVKVSAPSWRVALSKTACNKKFSFETISTFIKKYASIERF